MNVSTVPTYYGFSKYFSHADLAADPGYFLTDNDKLVIDCRITIFQTLARRRLGYAPVPNPDWPMQGFIDLGADSMTLVLGAIEEEQEEKPCHTFHLAAQSPVLRTMLTMDMLERSTGRIRMPDVSVATGRELLYFLYTSHVRPTTNPQELVPVADKYEIVDLKKYCGEVLGATINDANWMELLLLGDLYTAEGKCCGSAYARLDRDWEWYDFVYRQVPWTTWSVMVGSPHGGTTITGANPVSF